MGITNKEAIELFERYSSMIPESYKYDLKKEKVREAKQLFD